MAIPTVQNFNDAKTDLNSVSDCVNSAELTYSSRLAGEKLSLSGAIAKIVHGAITTYSAAATYTEVDEWVENSGIVYRPLPSELPIGPESFDANKWIVVQGFKLGDRLFPAVSSYDDVRNITTTGLVTGTPCMVTNTGIGGHGVLKTGATANVITGITQANPAVVTYSGADNWSNGDTVYIKGVVGMTEVNDLRFTVANVDTGANTFELSGVDSSAYTAYSSGGLVSNDDGGTIIVINANWYWERAYDKLKVSPMWFGAAANGTTDDTDAFNLASQAALVYSSVERVEIDLAGANYAVLGRWWIRKGQCVSGNGARLFMSSTGSIKLGYRDDDTQDGGGAPVTVKDLWIEGGSNPIIALIPGYIIHNVFSSSPASGCIFSGSDALITDCIFDNASTACTYTARNSSMVACDFYVSNTQMFIGAEDSVIDSCTFNYAKVAAIDWASTTVKNVRISNCSFVKNAQDGGTFLGYVRTRTVTTAPVGDLTFDGCNFRNCYGPAIRNYGTSSHRMIFRNCEFNGDKTNTAYAQGTTMYMLDMNSAAASGTTEFIDCKALNLLATPVQVNTNEPAVIRFKDMEFKNNAGTTTMTIAGANTQTIEFENIKGEGTSKDLFSVSNSPTIKYAGYMRDWLKINDDGTNKYVEIPFVDPMLIDVSMSANPAPGSNGAYRMVEKMAASISYDFASGALATIASVSQLFQSSTGIGANLAVSAAVDTIATGSSKATALSNGKLILYWTNVYTDVRINVEPRL